MGFECFWTALGQLHVQEADGLIKRLGFGPGADVATGGPSAMTGKAREEIMQYLSGCRRAFSLPLAPEGTAFQQAVWQELRRIPYGETRSYADIARAIGRDKAFRAVGQANHNNPIAIIIPCHRVITSGGSIGGYAGGADIKLALLALERKIISKNNKIILTDGVHSAILMAQTKRRRC